jgi:Bacterial protein of unknown function (Gcw_chp)
MNGNMRNKVRVISALGVMLLFFLICLPPLAAQEKGEYPGESATAPVPGAANPEQPASEDKPTASAGVDVLSQYVWRGFALSRNSAVLQPSITVGYKGFSVNVWGNFDTSENAPFALTPRTGAKWNETDFTAGYSREIFKTDWMKSLTLNVGCIYYAYDTTLYPQGDSFELYYGLVADFNIFKIGVQGNTEVFHYPGNWLTVGISRVFDLPWHKMTLELGNNYVFLFSRDFAGFPATGVSGAYPATPFSNPASSKSFSGPLSGQIYATLTIPINQYISIAPKGGFWYGLGGNSTQLLRFGSWDGLHNHGYGGVNVNFSF